MAYPMQRILMMAARVLGPILITRLLRRRKTKRPEEEPGYREN